MQEALQAPIRIISESSNYTGFRSMDRRSLDVQLLQITQVMKQLGDDSVEREPDDKPTNCATIYFVMRVSIPSRHHKELKCRLGR